MAKNIRDKSKNIPIRIKNTLKPEDKGTLIQNQEGKSELDPFLGYQLSKNMDLELRIYDAFALEIFRKYFNKGLNGGKGAMIASKEQYNKLYLTSAFFNNKELPSGVYFYRIEAGDFVKTQKMILMK